MSDDRVCVAVLDRDQSSLEALAEKLTVNVEYLEGLLADDYEHDKMVTLFGADAIQIGRSLRWPRRRERHCRVYAKAEDLRAALVEVPDTADWTFERGMLRDVAAFDSAGLMLWRIDSDTGVLHVYPNSADLYDTVLALGAGLLPLSGR